MSGRFSMNRTYKDILTRTWLIYVLMLVSFFVCGRYTFGQRSARVQTLSRLSPEYDFYLTFGINEHPSQKDLEDCIFYYKEVAATIPKERGPALHMLGYCLYGLGEDRKAIAEIEKSIAKMPYFFWSQYNRGVYYFNHKDYAQAVRSFDEALSLRQNYFTTTIFASKVFLEVLVKSTAQPKEDDPSVRLINGYKDAQVHFFLSNICQQTPGVPVCKEKLRMKYF
jgi:tetratricopeptide (TPR) repeat protein